MPSDGIKPRTILEYLAIIGVIYFLFGGQLPGRIVPSRQASEEEEPFPISREKIESLVYPDPLLECDPHLYNAHIFSSSPLIIYIPSFLSDEEQKHMVEIRYTYLPQVYCDPALRSHTT